MAFGKHKDSDDMHGPDDVTAGRNIEREEVGSRRVACGGNVDDGLRITAIEI